MKNQQLKQQIVIAALLTYSKEYHAKPATVKKAYLNRNPLVVQRIHNIISTM